MGVGMKSELEISLPYGMWRCAGGREVLFNRAYQPLWSRINGEVEQASLDEWVAGIEEEQFFFDDADSPLWANPGGARDTRQAALARAQGALLSWGLPSV